MAVVDRRGNRSRRSGVCGVSGACGVCGVCGAVVSGAVVVFGTVFESADSGVSESGPSSVSSPVAVVSAVARRALWRTVGADSTEESGASALRGDVGIGGGVDGCVRCCVKPSPWVGPARLDSEALISDRGDEFVQARSVAVGNDVS
jgi:hypothetical protein